MLDNFPAALLIFRRFDWVQNYNKRYNREREKTTKTRFRYRDNISTLVHFYNSCNSSFYIDRFCSLI